MLKPFNLDWNDVEDVVPMHDIMQRVLVKRRPQSNNYRQAWLCRGKTAQEVESAFKKALTLHVAKTTTVLELFKDIQTEQDRITEYQHSPFYPLVNVLNENGSKDGDMLEDVFRHQIFNWLGASP